jgi:hypothetical protein
VITRNPISNLASKVASILSYSALKRRIGNQPVLDAERELNPTLSGYPRNHDYTVRSKTLVPGFKLHERFRLVSELCKPGLESFLDVGSCRGFYAMSAAQMPGCKRALGVDIDEPFISLSSQVRDHLELKNCEFKLAGINEIAEEPERFGAPFTTVLNVGTYHYLYWGSERCSTALYDHRKILSRFAKICTKRLILSARLEMDRLPKLIRTQAEEHEKKSDYTTEGFLKAAAEFFDVEHRGFLGAYPLFLMNRK